MAGIRRATLKHFFSDLGSRSARRKRYAGHAERRAAAILSAIHSAIFGIMRCKLRWWPAGAIAPLPRLRDKAAGGG
jgi:hypothetical protein